MKFWGFKRSSLKKFWGFMCCNHIKMVSDKALSLYSLFSFLLNFCSYLYYLFCGGTIFRFVKMKIMNTLFVTICYNHCMDKYILLLNRLGMTEKAAKIYLKLLEHGTASISEICQRTELHRPEVYRNIPILIEKSLIEEVIRGKRTFYKAGSPDHIESLIHDFESRSKPLISELQNQYEKLGKNISVSYEEWPRAVSKVFSDIVNTLPRWAVFYRVSAEENVDKANSYLPKDYREIRDKKGLERYVIISSKTAKMKRPRLEREMVIIPESIDEFDENISMTIYGDKIAYIDFSNESSVIIENPMIAAFQRKLFTLTYKYLKG